MTKVRVCGMILLAAVAGCILLAAPQPAEAQRVAVGVYAPIVPVYPAPRYGGRPLGQVKLKTPVTDAQIFINGTMVGKARDLKKFYLVPGTYNVEQHIGSDVQKQKIYVIAGRAVHLEFGVKGTPSPAPLPPPTTQIAPAPPPRQPAPAPESAPAPQAAPAPQSAPAPAESAPAPAESVTTV